MSDLIERQAAIEAIRKSTEKYNYFMGMEEYTDEDAIEAIKAVPSAEKQGEWLWKLADNGWVDHICSECGWTENTDIHVSLGYNFCPRCGADMRGDR